MVIEWRACQGIPHCRSLLRLGHPHNMQTLVRLETSRAEHQAFLAWREECLRIASTRQGGIWVTMAGLEAQYRRVPASANRYGTALARFAISSPLDQKPDQQSKEQKNGCHEHENQTDIGTVLPTAGTCPVSRSAPAVRNSNRRGFRLGRGGPQLGKERPCLLPIRPTLAPNQGFRTDASLAQPTAHHVRLGWPKLSAAWRPHVPHSVWHFGQGIRQGSGWWRCWRR